MLSTNLFATVRSWATVLCLLVMLVMASIETSANTSPDLQAISGSRVYLDIPDNYIQEDGFIGIRHQQEHSLVVISEVPSSYLEFSKQYEDDQLSKKGMTVRGRKLVESDGLSGQRIIVEHEIRGEQYVRHIFITGDTKESLIIAGFYPKRLKRQLSNSVQHTIDTAFWDSSRSLDLFEGLKYRIDDVPGLRLATRVNESLVFTNNGRLPDQYYTAALLIMSVKEVPKEAALEENFAKNQFNHITLLENHQIERVLNDSLNGMDSVIVEGIGTHRHLGYKVAAIQLMLRTDVGFLVAQGFSTLDNREQDFDMFLTIVSTFRLQ